MALEITDANFEELVLKSDSRSWLTFGLSGVDLAE
jgi:hypothetical protein